MSEEASAETANLEGMIDEATDAVRVASAGLDEMVPGVGGGDPISMGQLLDVPVEVTVEIGSSQIHLGELVKLGPGSVLELDREAHEPADILVNGKVVARGEIVTVDDRYGVRITSVTT